MTDPTQRLDSKDILKTSEIQPHDLIRVHLPLKVKRPFLGLVPTGQKAKITFCAKHPPKDMRVLLVKPRGYEIAKLSHKLIQLDPNLTEDSVEVEQANASAEPNLTMHIDYYSTGLDFCKNKLGHNPTCQHHMGSVTLRYSLAYAKLLAVIAAVGAPLKWLQEKMVAVRETVRLKAYTAYISALRMLRQFKDVPDALKTKISSTLTTLHEKTKRVSRVPQAAQTHTRIAGAQSRNMFRSLSRNPLLAGIAILVLGGATVLVASVGNFSMPSFASPKPELQAEPPVQPRQLATRYELRCQGEIRQVNKDTLRETDCTITGLDGEPPDELICENNYQVIKTATGLELVGCKGIWHNPPHQS